MKILLGIPLDERLKSAFVKGQNNIHRMPCAHEFIKEDEAEDFAESLKTEIEAHKIDLEK